MDIQTSKIIVKTAKKKNGNTTTILVWNRLLDIAEKRNIKVHLTNLVELNGFYFRDKDTPVCIALAFNINTSRIKGSNFKKRNFVFAHELAHNQLDKIGFNTYDILSPSFKNDKRYRERAAKNEEAANKLAERLIRFLERSESKIK